VFRVELWVGGPWYTWRGRAQLLSQITTHQRETDSVQPEAFFKDLLKSFPIWQVREHELLTLGQYRESPFCKTTPRFLPKSYSTVAGK